MKILFLPAYCVPEQAASGYLGLNRNEAYASLGWDMVVYAPTPCRGISKELRKEYCRKEHRLDYDFDGHRAIHRFSMCAEGKNSILRALRYALISLKHICHGVFSKDALLCDVLFVSSTPPINGAMAAIVKKCRRDHIPFIYC